MSMAWNAKAEKFTKQYREQLALKLRSINLILPSWAQDVIRSSGTKRIETQTSDS